MNTEEILPGLFLALSACLVVRPVIDTVRFFQCKRRGHPLKIVKIQHGTFGRCECGAMTCIKLDRSKLSPTDWRAVIDEIKKRK